MDQTNHQPDIKRIFGNIALIFVAVILPGLEWSLFGWVQLFLPILVFVFLIKYGTFIGGRYILAGAGLAILVGLFTQPFDVLLFSLALIPAGYVLAKSALRGDSPAMSGLKCAATLGACWGLLIAGVGAVTGNSPYIAIQTTLSSGIDSVVKEYSQNEQVGADTAIMLEATLEQMKVIIPIILPAIFLSFAMFSTWFTMVLGNRLVHKYTGRQVWPRYRFWQLPDKLIWLGILSAFMAFLPLGIIKGVAVNILILLSVLYCMQGFAVCVFYMNKWNVPILLRSFIYVMIVLQSLGTIVLLMVGVADTWLNLRKLNVPDTESKEDSQDE